MSAINIEQFFQSIIEEDPDLFLIVIILFFLASLVLAIVISKSKDHDSF